jgi:hypothetical protein
MFTLRLLVPPQHKLLPAALNLDCNDTADSTPTLPYSKYHVYYSHVTTLLVRGGFPVRGPEALNGRPG